MNDVTVGRKPLGAYAPYKDRAWLKCRLHRPVSDIADVAGCSTTTIYHWLEKHGLAVKVERVVLPRLDPFLWGTVDVAALYEQGYSLRAIGTAGNVSHETVRQALIDAGHELRSRGGRG